jgi:lipopolysaccharide export LptBFGC system permease protein LptF
MTMSVIFFVVAILIIGIYLMFGFKRAKHKFFSIFLIFLVLFLFISLTSVFGGKDLSVKSVSDLGNLATTYFLWLGNLFGNFKEITANAVGMDWKGNQTAKTT